MRQSTVTTTSAQRGVERAEDAASDLRGRLNAFRHTHPYHEVQVAGRRWRYVIGGQGERALLLLPGSLVPDLFFVPIEALERDCRVIVPAYAAVPTMAELVAGVAAILDAEGVARVDVIGSSFGGYVAQCFVRAYPERVDRLILAETGVRHFVSWAPSIFLLAHLMNVLPTSLVRFLMWRIWSTLFTPPASHRAFWRELIQEILTTQLTKANFVSETRVIADFSAHYHSEVETWQPGLARSSSWSQSAMRPIARRIGPVCAPSIRRRRCIPSAMRPTRPLQRTPRSTFASCVSF